MKVLLSALACEPEKGSELEVGFQTMLAAASKHDVWVLTNAGTITSTRRAVETGPYADRIRLVGIPFGVSTEEFAQLTVSGFHVHYDRWQRRAAQVAVQLDREVDFDLVHHVTLASYWTRTGVAAVEKPLVLGPVGGGVDPPLRLFSELGRRGMLEDASRVLTRKVLGRLPPAATAQRRAVVTFAQNEATARRLLGRGRLIVLSNALSADTEHVESGSQRSSDLVYAGRLIPWKAPILALRVLRYVRNPACVLRFCGEGPEQARLERAAAHWGLTDRVRFDGWLPRQELLKLVAGAGALIHPAMHEEAGLCIAEAIALGTPVVCLQRGGPAELLRERTGARGVAVPPRGPTDTARAMAAAIDGFLAAPSVEDTTVSTAVETFSAEILAAYDYACGYRWLGHWRGRRRRGETVRKTPQAALALAAVRAPHRGNRQQQQRAGEP
jgi:glycosyltransferase involved in cell wall biosynthesis